MGLRITRKCDQKIMIEHNGEIYGEIRIVCPKGIEVDVWLDGFDGDQIVREELYIKDQSGFNKLATWRCK